MSYRLISAAALLALAACATRNERFEDAWMGNCYLHKANHLVMGDPLPGSPGQYYSEEWENSMYPKSDLSADRERGWR